MPHRRRRRNRHSGNNNRHVHFEDDFNYPNQHFGRNSSQNYNQSDSSFGQSSNRHQSYYRNNSRRPNNRGLHNHRRDGHIENIIGNGGRWNRRQFHNPWFPDRTPTSSQSSSPSSSWSTPPAITNTNPNPFAFTNDNTSTTSTSTSNALTNPFSTTTPVQNPNNNTQLVDAYRAAHLHLLRRSLRFRTYLTKILTLSKHHLEKWLPESNIHDLNTYPSPDGTSNPNPFLAALPPGGSSNAAQNAEDDFQQGYWEGYIQGHDDGVVEGDAEAEEEKQILRVLGMDWKPEATVEIPIPLQEGEGVRYPWDGDEEGKESGVETAGGEENAKRCLERVEMRGALSGNSAPSGGSGGDSSAAETVPRLVDEIDDLVSDVDAH